MLEKPDLADEWLISTLRNDFGLAIETVTFLPIGRDANTAVYRADDHNGQARFVKLRRGEGAGASVEIAHLLHDRGIEQVIRPLRTRNGALWARLDDFLVSVSPFVAGSDGFDRELSDDHWLALGSALRRIHDTTLPDTMAEQIPREDYSDHWRDLTRTFQQQAESGDVPDEVAARLAELMRGQRYLISRLIDHAERLGDTLRERCVAHVPCHADIHGGNVLIDDDGQLYIVDWDTFMLAPQERDLMFIGGGIGRNWRGKRNEWLFYEGYGRAEIDLEAIAYYRCERIIQDFAESGKQLFLSSEGGADREQSLHYFTSNFQAGGTINIALASVRRAG